MLRRLTLLIVAVTAMAALGTALPVGAKSPDPSKSAVPKYDHIFVIVEENHGFHDVIGNPAAPNLNALAKQFGLATNYFGVAHPSEPNYIALLGGSTFGVTDDNPYYLNNVTAPSLITQLDAKDISWKAYLQGLPYAGYKSICYPANCNGVPDKDPLYVSKHDAIQNFVSSRNAKDWSRQVPVEALKRDLAHGEVPRFGYVIPDECHDQHGDPPFCLDSGTPLDPQDQRLVATGDRYLGQVVSTITNAKFWSHGNNAIAVVYDEGDDTAGCCGANPGGGQVATVVVTNHGPRGIEDPTPANHYSLLKTIQQSFGLGCLANTCDDVNVAPLSALFAVKDTEPIGTHASTVPNLSTPTPTPTEPAGQTTKTVSGGGFTVVKGPMSGTGDNSLGSVSGTRPGDVWAAGNFLPDTTGSNPDATLSLAAHWDGHTWSPVPTPNAGPNFNTFFGVATADSRAWAVGVHLDDDYRARALVEQWDGSHWSVVDVPQPGEQRDMFFAASARSTSDVWAVGDRQDSEGRFATLVEHFDGSRWSVIPSPDPGKAGNHLYGVAAVGPDNVWAVGQRLDAEHGDRALIEHWDGDRWTVVPSDSAGHSASMLLSVAVRHGQVWAAGQTEDEFSGVRPLVLRIGREGASAVTLPTVASKWTTLWGITVADDGVYADGTSWDAASATVKTFMVKGDERGWRVLPVPSPGSGDNVLGGIAAVGDDVWAVGYFKDPGRMALTERHNVG